MKFSIVDSLDPESPIRALVYGCGGVGKSTFASTAPDPVFIASEAGLKFMKVRRVKPFPGTYQETLEAIEYLREDKSCKTIVIDSADWLEPLIHSFICERDEQPSIEMYHGGYGKGYSAAGTEWRDMLRRLDACEKNVIIIAHARKKSVQNTIGADYVQTSIKVNETAAGILIEWCDVVAFADIDTEIEEGKKVNKAVTTSKRIMRMNPHPGLTAKVRAPEGIKVPSRVPLTWHSVLRALGRIKKEDE